MTTRPTRVEDLSALRRILDSTELFPSEMLSDMIGDFLSGTDSDDIWLTCEVDGQVAGFCYARPEALTDGTWNMLAIAVLPDVQGKGGGSEMTNHLESVLRKQGQRVLIVDTSGTDEFANTRAFYRKNGYAEEARIRDYWAQGDDKVIFRKSLN